MLNLFQHNKLTLPVIPKQVGDDEWVEKISALSARTKKPCKIGFGLSPSAPDIVNRPIAVGAADQLMKSSALAS
jgi:hypothetical protein